MFLALSIYPNIINIEVATLAMVKLLGCICVIANSSSLWTNHIQLWTSDNFIRPIHIYSTVLALSILVENKYICYLYMQDRKHY